MASRRSRPTLALACLSLLGIILPTADALGQDTSVCLECHGEREIVPETGDLTRSLYVDHAMLQASAHVDFECIDCHMDLEEQTFPHEVAVEPVSCAECHDEEGEIYGESFHGRQLEAGDPLAPTCASCHGKHDILHSRFPESRTTFSNIPRVCGSCHQEGAPVQQAREIPQDHVLRNYSQSIHGEGLFQKGLSVTAVCTSCHTAHSVLPHDETGSTIHRDNITGVCMRCHILIEDVHRQVIRGELWETEPHKIPVCVDCHAPHEIRNVFYEEGMADGDCLECHGNHELRTASGGEERSLFVDRERAYRSKHGGIACAQCHLGATPSSEFRPCSTITERVDCSVCHAAEVEEHSRSVHGTLAALRDPDAPTCNDCHEHHDTLGQEQPESPTFPTNVPGLCARCHTEGAKAASREASSESEIVSHYTMSVHGTGLLESGLLVTAVCTDCHTAHLALPADDPESSVHADQVAQTCAQCHHGIYEQFASSVHFTSTSEGEAELPSCSDCHSPHSIARTDQGDFKLDIIDRCGRCHEEVTETYFETYHGKVSRLGAETSAKCYHCHGAHDVLPVSDPRSHLSRDNIVGTCKQCHEGAHRQFAGYLTHATHHNREKYPFLFYAFWGMTLLLVGTLVVAGSHTALWIWRGYRHRERRAPHGRLEGSQHVRRLTAYQRWLHLIMLISFFGLAITGMMLKFSYMGWARFLSDLMGGFEPAGQIHRACAVLTFGYFTAHVVDLAKLVRRKGWRGLFNPETTMMPTKRDWRELKATWRWFLGKGEFPSYGRWTYWEKFDYFAVFWGVAIIGSTGLLLWFPETFTLVLPGQVINVATIIHSDEALLAVGFIFTIHFFNTHFRPGKFPMDPVMFTGSVPLEEFKQERRKRYDELVASGELESRLVHPKSVDYVRAVRIFGLSALALGLLLIALILYAMIFGYR